MYRAIRRIAAITLAGVALITLSGCVTDADSLDPTPVKTFKITPAANRTALPASPATATVSPVESVAGPPLPGAGDDRRLDLTARDLKFDKEDLSATAGSITIHLDNRDSGTVHNIHVFKGTNSSGGSAGTTRLEIGPSQQDLNLALQPGAYYYQCDAHPATMHGKLSVS